MGIRSEAIPLAEPHRRTDPALAGHMLVICRAIWLAVALLELVLLLLNVLAPAFGGKTTICPFSSTCGYAPTTLQALQHAQISTTTFNLYLLVLSLLDALITVGLGILIFFRKSEQRSGWLASLVLLLLGTGLLTGDTSTMPLALQRIASDILTFCSLLAFGFFLVTFPDGRLVPRWSWLAGSSLFVQGFLYQLPGAWSLPNWPAPLYVLEVILAFGSPVAVQIYRSVRISTPAQRQQTKWAIFGLVCAVLLVVLQVLAEALFPSLNAPNSLYPLVSVSLLPSLSFLFIPVGISIAILRSRLWDIDILINRTLVYALLTASTLGLYVLIVFGMSSLLHAQHNDQFFSLLATALIAVLFQPLRHWLQQGVNRLMFGERNEPYRVLSRLGQRLVETLPAESLLPTIVETVAHTLKLPYVAIVWKREQVLPGTEPPLLAAAFGKSLGSQAMARVPLVHQGKHLGELILSPRGREEELSPADLRLVRDLAPQIGMALHSALLLRNLQGLTVDLQRSRERLVTAREEERRRLRRDLHDGLGPQLSSQTLTLSAIRKLLRQDPERADELLVAATTHAQKAIVDIRRLVYALRPPALDDLGLQAALQEQMNQYHASGIMLSLEAPEALPPLPAAIEIACYRIVQEALTNVVRHAHATHATVGLCLQPEALEVEVSDDGQGLPPGVRSGVGLTSMRERAEELGGTCLVKAIAGGGTRVCAQLPLPVGQPEENATAEKGEGMLL